MKYGHVTAKKRRYVVLVMFVQLVGSIFCFCLLPIFGLWPKQLGVMGLLPPVFLWVSGVLHHSLACCLVDEGTKYDGILAFI